MKAKIKKVEYLKEYESKFGLMHSFRIYYDNKTAYYSCKTKDQNKFTENQEAEFTETEMTGKNGKYLTIKPIQQLGGQYGKAVKKEQTKYSGFAVSYTKDLIIAGKVDITEISEYSAMLFNLMVELDKSIEQ